MSTIRPLGAALRPLPIRILELRSVKGTGGGPDKTIIGGAARTDRRRFAVTVAYIRDARDPGFGIHEKAAAEGVDYVEIVERHSTDPSIVGQLRALVRERAIDIVHAHDYKTDLLALLLARLEGTIPLSTAHGWSGHSKRERWFYYPIDRQLLRTFPRVVAVSSDIGEALAASGVARKRIRVLLNGIDHMRFRRSPESVLDARSMLGIRAGDFVVGAIGRLEREKRYDLLIDACARLAARHRQLRLFIAGEGSLRAPLQVQAVERLGPDTVRFLGHYADVIGLHHALDVFVQSSSNEGTPNVVLEAMALGTPVVATAVGGTAELIRDRVDGLLVPPGDVAALAEAIENCILHDAPRRDRARAARARVEGDLSFDRRQMALEAVYEELIEERAARQASGRTARAS
jgi:glycosyltransferase involved in cell wall biosynthesis